MMNKRLKPEFVACLKKCIDDHSTYKTDELDRKQILKRSVRELERMKNGAEVSECSYAYFKKRTGRQRVLYMHHLKNQG